MSSQTYNWKRLWCPRTGSVSLADGGYLYVPALRLPGVSNAVAFESLAATPCLVLLGEPGIGKSTTMKAEHASIENQVAETGDATLWFDLRSYQTDIRLCQAIFDHSVFQAWVKGTHRLHLFLDSMDECLLQINTLASLLTEEFPEISRQPAVRPHRLPHGRLAQQFGGRVRATIWQRRCRSV